MEHVKFLILAYTLEPIYRPARWLPRTNKFFTELVENSTDNPRAMRYVKKLYNAYLREKCPLDDFIRKLSKSPCGVALDIVEKHIEFACVNHLGDNPNPKAKKILELIQTMNFQPDPADAFIRLYHIIKQNRQKSIPINSFAKFCRNLEPTPENQAIKISKFEELVGKSYAWSNLESNSDPVVVELLKTNQNIIEFTTSQSYKQSKCNIFRIAQRNIHLFVPVDSRRFIRYISKYI